MVRVKINAPGVFFFFINLVELRGRGEEEAAHVCHECFLTATDGAPSRMGSQCESYCIYELIIHQYI